MKVMQQLSPTLEILKRGFTFLSTLSPTNLYPYQVLSLYRGVEVLSEAGYEKKQCISIRTEHA